MAPETVENARQLLANLRIEGLILVGGDGSLTTGQQLYEAGFPIIGVPKTIDNDLEATAMTFGFDSAVACVADSLDRLHTTGKSHKRVMVLEVMGRHAGWIALYGGLAGGANVILLPEIPFTYEKLAEYLNTRDREGYVSSLVVVAEGAKPAGGEQAVRSSAVPGEYQARRHRRAGGGGDRRPHGQGNALHRAGAFAARRHADDTRPDPGHALRGAWRCKLIEEKRFGTMVSYLNYQVTGVPIADCGSQAAGW